MNAYYMVDPEGKALEHTLGRNPAHVLYLSGWFLAAFHKKPEIMAALRKVRRKGYRVVKLEVA